MDSHVRSIVKTVSYRTGGLIVTSLTAYAITGETKAAAAVGLADTVAKFAMYYLHERMWTKIRLGQSKPPEYQI